MARTTKKEPGVVSTYKKAFNYTCPVRGPVTQIFDVKVYEYGGTPLIDGSLPELETLLETYKDDDE